MPELPEFITVESAIAQLVEVLEHTSPEERPPIWSVVMAVSEGYGEEAHLDMPPFAQDRGWGEDA